MHFHIELAENRQYKMEITTKMVESGLVYYDEKQQNKCSIFELIVYCLQRH